MTTSMPRPRSGRHCGYRSQDHSVREVQEHCCTSSQQERRRRAPVRCDRADTRAGPVEDRTGADPVRCVFAASILEETTRRARRRTRPRAPAEASRRSRCAVRSRVERRSVGSRSGQGAEGLGLTDVDLSPGSATTSATAAFLVFSEHDRLRGFLRDDRATHGPPRSLLVRRSGSALITSPLMIVPFFSEPLFANTLRDRVSRRLGKCDRDPPVSRAESVARPGRGRTPKKSLKATRAAASPPAPPSSSPSGSAPASSSSP